jgi:hypothetical protein
MSLWNVTLPTTSCVGDTCGWIAALIALFAAGTYGVPIKETMYQITDLNPFVFQTYKVIIFFLVSMTAVVLLDIPIRMTFYYGTLSGFLWVCGGTGGIVAVRYAGLATAVGTWASVMICINFTWGILVFHEPVVNMYNTLSAFVLLALGLLGMSTYGDPSNSKPTNVVIGNNVNTTALIGDHHERNLIVQSANDDIDSGTYKKDLDIPDRSSPSRKNTLSIGSARHRSYSDDEDEESSENAVTSTLLKQRKVNVKETCNDDETSVTESDSISSLHSNAAVSLSTATTHSETHVRLCGSVFVTKRVAGIMAALFNGFMSGSSLIPMHFAKRSGGWGGLNYLISFSTGSMISCAAIWMIYFFILMIRQHRSNKKSSNTSTSISNAMISEETEAASSFLSIVQQAASKMPDAHWKVLWKPGLAAGLLNAIGMVGSVLAVTYLGQGVGNSVIQCKIIVRCVVSNQCRVGV